MKKHTMMAYSLGIALHLAAFSVAFGAPGKGMDKRPSGPRAGVNRLEAMSERLNLSDQQKATVDKAMKEMETKLKAMHEEMTTRRKALTDEFEKKVTATLDAKQKEEFKKMKDEAEKRREKFRSQRQERMGKPAQ